MTISLLHRPALLGAALVGLSLLSASAAQAFTFEDQGASANGSGSHYQDLDLGKPASRFDDGSGKTVIKRGNSTFYVGGQGQSFDQRNNASDYFNPNYLMGR